MKLETRDEWQLPDVGERLDVIWRHAGRIELLLIERALLRRPFYGFLQALELQLLEPLARHRLDLGICIHHGHSGQLLSQTFISR